VKKVAKYDPMKDWREQWIAQAKLERGMGIAGSQLQTYRA
jgi:hypothetical protein